ncbi:hypothetical protein CWI36_0217p0010 [Hamiltosporidium magnivora]|uniref:Uncharacterized protein n=1 Tax=Hamiltosporidium magnivora TaxID=148818 RepID=A0A4Q9LI68_9MICR|nr:hypothetical protein CWI36_0217p0010 [Hamiltosporidium magnivora]
MNKIIQIFLLKINFIFLGRNKINYIQNLEDKFREFLDLYVDSIQKQLFENSKYDLHLISINNINKTEHSCAQVLKYIPIKKFDLNFLITSYTSNHFVRYFFIFSFYKQKTSSAIKFRSTESNIVKFKKSVLILDHENAYSFIARFIVFFEKIFKVLNTYMTEYDGVFIIQPIKSAEYNENVMTEILRTYNDYFYLNLVIIINNESTDFMRNNIISNENFIKEYIKQYFFVSLKARSVIGLIDKIKHKIQDISFLSFDLPIKINRDGFLNHQIRNSSYNIPNFRTNYIDKILYLCIDKYVVIKNHRILVLQKKLKHLNFYRIFKISRTNENGKKTQTCFLYLFLYTLEIKRSIHFFSFKVKDKTQYDLKITLKKHVNLDPDVIMFKTMTTWDFSSDYYDVKKVLLNMIAKNPSEFKDLIKYISSNTKE